MPRLLGIFAFLFTFLTLGTAGILLWGMSEFQKSAPITAATMFSVESGSSLSSISTALHSENLISNADLFKIAVKILKMDTSLKAGEYEIAAHSSMAEILELLTNGKTFQRNFTIPEGLTSFEIVNILNGVELLSGEPITDIPPEGSLLPETYSYQKDETRVDVLARMQGAMNDVHNDLCADATPETTCWNAPLKSWEEVIILASIVEKETGVGLERSKVAGVFINRLKRGIALQTDPTVIYAIHQGRPKNGGRGPLGRRLLRKDLAIDSPYNTYKYPGLPPGPIANPGRAAVAAVLNPEEHNFIYFVADGTGGHMFARTLDEHNRNVAKWRKIRRAMK